MSILCSGFSRQCINQMHVNQDEFGCVRVLSPSNREITVAMVCDGISMGYEGKYASYNTVLWLLEWASQYFVNNDFEPEAVASEIQRQMTMYNHLLNDYSDKHSNNDTCCTVCGLVTDENQLLIFNAGDSRLYELQPDARVRRLTEDDKAEDGYSIAMHIGGKNDSEVSISFSVDRYNPSSRYVICSDGFYKRTDFQANCQLFFSGSNRREIVSLIKDITDELVNMGETDDITAVILARSE